VDEPLPNGRTPTNGPGGPTRRRRLPLSSPRHPSPQSRSEGPHCRVEERRPGRPAWVRRGQVAPKRQGRPGPGPDRGVVDEDACLGKVRWGVGERAGPTGGQVFGSGHVSTAEGCRVLRGRAHNWATGVSARCLAAARSLWLRSLSLTTEAAGVTGFGPSAAAHLRRCAGATGRPLPVACHAASRQRPVRSVRPARPHSRLKPRGDDHAVSRSLSGRLARRTKPAFGDETNAATRAADQDVPPSDGGRSPPGFGHRRVVRSAWTLLLPLGDSASLRSRVPSTAWSPDPR
jgi:hypothetical protein